jgi:glycerol kinase
MNTGRTPVASRHGLLTTVAWDLGKGYTYALEGSVFIAGAVIQWLRDQMGLLADSAESETLARSVEDTGEVFLVPAFVGLGAPYWDSDARGTVVGITRGTTKAHFVRAALESIAYQSKDLLDAMEKDFGSTIPCIKADGGASANSFLMQFQADVLDRRVVLPEVGEITALGAAYLAGLATGYWESLAEVEGNWRKKREFLPDMPEERRKRLLESWGKAVVAARGYK